MWTAARRVMGWWVNPGLGEMKVAISRARPACCSEPRASKAITRFSRAITRTRTCRISASVKAGTRVSNSSDANASCGPGGVTGRCGAGTRFSACPWSAEAIAGDDLAPHVCGGRRDTAVGLVRCKLFRSPEILRFGGPAFERKAITASFGERHAPGPPTINPARFLRYRFVQLRSLRARFARGLIAGSCPGARAPHEAAGL